MEVARYQNFLRYLQAPQVAKSSGDVATAPAGQAPAGQAPAGQAPAAGAAAPAAQGAAPAAQGAAPAAGGAAPAGSPPVGKQGWLRLSSQTLGVNLVY